MSVLYSRITPVPRHPHPVTSRRRGSEAGRNHLCQPHHRISFSRHLKLRFLHSVCRANSRLLICFLCVLRQEGMPSLYVYRAINASFTGNLVMGTISPFKSPDNNMLKNLFLFLCSRWRQRGKVGGKLSDCRPGW